MDIDKTVELVTREVMKRLRELSCSERTEPKGSILILDSLDNICLNGLVSKLKDLNYKVEGIENFNQKIDISEYKCLIAPILENRDLSNISMGVSCGMVSEMIINGILQGKEIFIIEEGIEYRKYVKTCSKLFYSKLQEHENNLRSYGIEILDEKQLYKALEKKNGTSQSPIPLCPAVEPSPLKDFAVVDKKILTEMDVQRLFREGSRRISIKRKSIVTPLALDYIKLNNIEVIRTE